MTQRTQSGLHYAWVILLAACVLSIVARADSASFGVFVDPLVALFGWKRGDISFAYSLAFLLGLPATIMGWLGDRYGARPLMLGASILIRSARSCSGRSRNCGSSISSTDCSSARWGTRHSACCCR